MIKRLSIQRVYIDGFENCILCEDQKGEYVRYLDLKPLADRVDHTIKLLEDDTVTNELKIKNSINELKNYLIQMRGSEDKRKNKRRFQ